MPIVRSATMTIASQIKIESPLAFGPSDHQPFFGILRLLESYQAIQKPAKYWCNSHRNGFFEWIVSSDEQVQTCSIQFAAWLSMFTSNNQPVASFSSKCFDASTFASSTATKSQKDCDIIPTARNQFNSATMFTRHQDTQPSTNAAQAKPVSWNLTQSQEMVLQTSKTLLRNIRSHWILLKRAKQLQKSKFSRDNKFLISSIVL